MAKVETIPPVPTPPEYRITLSEKEAIELANLLNVGVSGHFLTQSCLNPLRILLEESLVKSRADKSAIRFTHIAQM